MPSDIPTFLGRAPRLVRARPRATTWALVALSLPVLALCVAFDLAYLAVTRLR